MTGRPSSWTIRHPEKRLAVVTNSILAVSELSGLPHIDLYVVGGSVGGNLPASLGTKANEDISRFKVDKAFIGVHSVSFEAGITAITDAQMQMKQAILKTTQKVIVLADSSRFGGGYFSVICPISSVFRIVTDSATVFIPMTDLVDPEEEKTRLCSELEKVNAEIARVEGKLSNKGFTEKAPAAVVDAEKVFFESLFRKKYLCSISIAFLFLFVYHEPITLIHRKETS